MSFDDIKEIPSREDQVQSSKVGACLVRWRNAKKASVAAVEEIVAKQ